MWEKITEMKDTKQEGNRRKEGTVGEVKETCWGRQNLYSTANNMADHTPTWRMTSRAPYKMEMTMSWQYHPYTESDIVLYIIHHMQNSQSCLKFISVHNGTVLLKHGEVQQSPHTASSSCSGTT